MRKIGGMFHYEPSKPIENGYFSRICSPKDDLAFAMSGRCGIYYCLQDIARHDTRKVAYVPMYTCETVLAPFEKAGYQLKFYQFRAGALCCFFGFLASFDCFSKGGHFLSVE